MIVRDDPPQLEGAWSTELKDFVWQCLRKVGGSWFWMWQCLRKVGGSWCWMW